MIDNYKVITLCGSTRFKDEFMAVQKDLTLKKNIVISVGLFGHSGDDEVWTEGTKEMLDDMHKRKIDMSDEIFVINVGGYVGDSTRSEIEYAHKTGKPVNYLESPYGYPRFKKGQAAKIVMTEANKSLFTREMIQKRLGKIVTVKSVSLNKNLGIFLYRIKGDNTWVYTESMLREVKAPY